MQKAKPISYTNSKLPLRKLMNCSIGCFYASAQNLIRILIRKLRLPLQIASGLFPKLFLQPRQTVEIEFANFQPSNYSFSNYSIFKLSHSQIISLSNYSIFKLPHSQIASFSNYSILKLFHFQIVSFSNYSIFKLTYAG